MATHAHHVGCQQVFGAIRLQATRIGVEVIIFTADKVRVLIAYLALVLLASITFIAFLLRIMLSASSLLGACFIIR